VTLSWRARRRWSLVLLLLWLPAYVVAAVTVMNWLGRPGPLAELLVYVLLGLLWALPFRSVFRGIGRAEEPAGEDPPGQGRPVPPPRPPGRNS
jgi:hypothetical protein